MKKNSFENLFVFLMQNLEFCFRMAPPRKCAQKARKVSNTIEKQAVPNEKQAIVVYATLFFQCMFMNGAF